MNRQKKIISLLGLMTLLWVGTATAVTSITPSTNEVSLQLQQQVQQGTSVKLYQPQLLQQFYSQRQFQPAWFSDEAVNTATSFSLSLSFSLANELLHAINAAATEGLNPAYYHQSTLQQLLLSTQTPSMTTAPQLAELELRLSDAFLSYASHLVKGRLKPQTIHRNWTLQPRQIDLVSQLEKALSSKKIGKTLAQLNPAHAGFSQLKTALATYRELHEKGGWPLVSPGKKLELGTLSPRVAELRQRLAATGELVMTPVVTNLSPEPESTTPKHDPQHAFDAALEQAVLRFQRRHGLEDDGIVGPITLAALNVTVEQRIQQIELNMERWRWLPEDLGQRHILVNVPGFEMNLVENGQSVFHSKVIVGRKSRQTPIFSDTMSHLVLSPFWNVPYNIAVRDKLPLLRKNPYALSGKKIRIFNSAGQQIDPGQVDWTAVGRGNFGYRMRQDPGPKNALGKVKFMFPNKHSVYLHDTSSPRLFAKTKRTFSSGCIRVAKPLELAVQLLKNNPQWDADTIVAATQKRRQRRVELPTAVPVHLMYWTTWQDESGQIQFREDIYRRDQPLNKALLAFNSDHKAG